MSTVFFDNGGNIVSVDNPSAVYAIGVGFNEYATASVTPGGSFTTLLSKTIVDGNELNLQGLNVWGDTDADWILELESPVATYTVVGGTRTTPSRLAEEVSYAAPLTVTGPGTLRVKVKHYEPTNFVLMSCNLYGGEAGV